MISHQYGSVFVFVVVCAAAVTVRKGNNQDVVETKNLVILPKIETKREKRRGKKKVLHYNY